MNKIYLFFLFLFFFHPGIFALAPSSSISITSHHTADAFKCYSSANDSSGFNNLRFDTLRNFARFSFSENGYDFYYVRFSFLNSAFERIEFLTQAGDQKIYIADKNEVKNDSALFMTRLYREDARPAFGQLFLDVKAASASTAVEDQQAIAKSSPFYPAVTGIEPEPRITPLEGTNDCSSAQVSCSANTYSFPSGTSGTAPPAVAGYPNYGCLGSTPCPAWYYMQVGTPGDIIISISQVDLGGTPRDVDFICWGPFSNVTDGCATGLTGTCPKPTDPCCTNVNPGCTYPKGNMTDCSYSGNATETCHIYNAQVGEIYILLMTNFSQAAGTITFSQTGGTGITNCNIILHCTVIDISAIPTPCDNATNTFSVSGNVEFSNPSPTGTLTVTDITAIPPVSQTFNPPFVSPVPFNLAGLPCDGASHMLSAVFSDSLNCNLTQQFTAPSAPCPQAQISGGGAFCNDGAQHSTVTVSFPSGIPPFTFIYAINGVNQPPVVYNNTVPYVITTSTPGTYTLASVTTANMGCPTGIVTGTAVVTANPLPTAAISGSATVCQNAASPVLTFTGSGATAPYTFTYKVNGGPNQTISTVTGNSVTLPVPTGVAGTFVYQLVSVQDGGTTACTQPQAGSSTVVVNPLPSATISGTATVCQDAPSQPVTFTGTTGTPPYTFTYNINGGSNQTIATTVGNSVILSAPATIPGTYIYNLVSVQDASSPGCTQLQAGSATLMVNPLPSATISGNATVCQNPASQPVTFTGSGSTPPYTFTYNINWGANQTITTTAGNSIVLQAPVNIPGTFIYNLISVQDAGSTTCSQLQAGSATVTVNPLPTASISGTVSVCQGSPNLPVTFTGGSGTAPYTFTYNINGGASQTITTAAGNSVSVTVSTALPGTFTYTLESVQDASSTSCIQLQPGSAIVTVNPLPVASVSGTTTVCRNAAPQSITFTGGNGTPPYTFTYNINGGSALTVTTTAGNSATVTAPTGTAGTFLYNLVSVQDASSTLCSQLQNSSATLVVNPLPTATITGTVTVCQNAPPQLITFTGGSATPPYTFTYSINGGGNQIVSTVAGNSVTIAMPTNVAGTFTCNLISVSDASSTLCSQLQPGDVTVTVNPLPTANISGTTTVCQNAPSQPITFTGGSTIAPYTFTYNINGGAAQTITTAAGNSITLFAPTNVPGTYTYNLVSVRDAGSTTCSQLQPGSAVITINPRPVPTLAGPAAICLNASSSYTTDPGMSGYSWTVTTGGTISGGTTNNISVLWSSTGTKTITVNYTDLNGCTAPVASSYNVLVNTLPVPTLSGLNSICTGIPTVYTTEAGMSQYSWSVSPGGTKTGGGSITDPTVTVNWTTPGPNTVTVNYTLGTGCTAGSPTTYNVSVNPSSTPTITSPLNPICATSSTMYTTQPGMSGYAWTITPGGTVLSGSLTNTLTVRWNIAGIQSVTANYINAFNCTAVAPTKYDVTVNPLPVTTITENAVPVCQSVPHLYQTPADPSSTFTWTVIPSTNGVISGGQGTNAATIDWQNAGTSTVAVTGTNNTTGCLSSSTYVADVKPKPAPAFTPCFDLVTTPGAKKIILRGGAPSLPAQGIYSGTRVSFNPLNGYYQFDPLGATAGSYAVTYTYTNTFGCPANAGPVNISVQNIAFFCGSTLTDVRDGKTYKTAMLAGHCWMAQNLDYGAALVSSPVPAQTDNCIAEKYCAPTDATCSAYGGLYQWDEIMDYAIVQGSKGICPPEWHLPSDAEWQQLIDNLVAGIAAPNANALIAPELTDSFLPNGFYALLGGMNYLDNTWAFNTGANKGTMYWSSSLNASGQTVARGLNINTPSVSRYVSSRANAFSVRCIKD